MSPNRLKTLPRFTRLALIVALAGTGIAIMHQARSAHAVADAPFVQEVVLNHSPEKIWQALTRKALVDRYYFVPVGADIAQVGASISYGPPTEKMIVGTILALDAPRLLRHSFRFTGENGGPDTVVTYTLAAKPEGTALRVEHRGYANPSQGYADIAGGWPVILDRLKAVLDGQK